MEQEARRSLGGRKTERDKESRGREERDDGEEVATKAAVPSKQNERHIVQFILGPLM